MSDLFISYSRDDSDFVQNLHKAIESSNRDAWLDCFDIPKGEKFWDEITKGIDMADTFVFIMSPSSIKKASMEGDNAYCRREIEYAAQRNKRIIPIIYQEGFNLKRDILSHKILGERNWIFFTRPHNFESQFQELIRTIETDIAYVRKHTELTVAADVWDKGGRKDKSTLLQGMRLIEGEKWLQKGEAKAVEEKNRKYSNPTPTNLQKAYILESRTSANFRKIIVATWLIVPLILFVPGEYLWREALVSQSYKAAENRDNKLAQRDAVITLAGGCFAEQKYPWIPKYLRVRLFGNCQTLRGINLQKADLWGVNLSGAELRSSNLSGAIFLGANLSGATLDGANLRDATLGSANLSDAKLIIADLRGAALWNANLSNTFLWSADLSGANLANANLSGAKFYCTNYYRVDNNKLEKRKCTNLKDIGWSENTNWQNIDTWHEAENIPPALKQRLGLN